MSSLFGGGTQVSAVNPPAPIQLNLANLENQMVNADTAAYGAADQYMNQFYPALAQGRNLAIGQAFQNLTGPLNPSLENAFVNKGNMDAMTAFGGGDQSFGFGQGSAAKQSSQASVAQNVQGNEDYNRSIFQQFNSMYAPRAFGMTPEDAANVLTFNNTQFNNYLEQQFAAQTQAYYTNAGLSAGQQASQIGLLGSIAGPLIGAGVGALFA